MTEDEAAAEVVEETKVIRDRLWRSARRAQALQIALVALAGLAVVISAVFTTVNAHRISVLLERGEAQRKALTGLTGVIQTYNEQHAKQAESSFKTLNESQRCAILKLFTGRAFEKITPEEIAACYQPIAPAPPTPTTTTTREDR